MSDTSHSVDDGATRYVTTTQTTGDVQLRYTPREPKWNGKTA